MKPTIQRLVDAAKRVLEECGDCPCDATCEARNCPWRELRKSVEDAESKA